VTATALIDHPQQGRPSLKLLERPRRISAGPVAVHGGPQTTSLVAGEVHPLVDNEPGDDLPLMPPPDVQLAPLVERVPVCLENVPGLLDHAPHPLGIILGERERDI